MQEAVRTYNVGDRVWYAHYNMTQVQKTCPVCFGEKQVTLILGNKQRVILPCDYCGHGLDEPSGVIREYEYIAKTELITITRIERRTDKDYLTDSVREEVKYYSGPRYMEICDLFNSEEDARARCDEKVKQQEVEETTTAYHLKAFRLNSYAWNAGYHLKQAEKHRKDVKYHEQKAILCKARIRRGGTE